MTDGAGELYEHMQYFPSGELWVQQHSNTQRTPYLFSSKELEEETGLYDFGARYYDPRTSAWLSVDPAGVEYLPNPDDTLGQLPAGGVYASVNLNGYAYAGANPIKYTDPTGAPLSRRCSFLGARSWRSGSSRPQRTRKPLASPTTRTGRGRQN